MMSYQSIEIGSESTPLNRSESGKKSGSWQKKVVVILGVVALVAVGAALMGSSSLVGGANQDRSQLVEGTAPTQRGLNLVGDAVEADKLPSSKCPDTQLCNDKCRATCPTSWVSCYIGCLNSVACVGACPKQMVDLTKQGEKESLRLAQADGAFPSACADMKSCHDTCRATCSNNWVPCYIGCLNSPTCAKACPKMIAEQLTAKKAAEANGDDKKTAIAAAVDKVPATKCPEMLLCNEKCRATCPSGWVSCYIGCLNSPTCQLPSCPKVMLTAEQEEAVVADGLPPSKCPNTQLCNDKCRATCPSSWVSCYIGCLNSVACVGSCPKQMALDQEAKNMDDLTKSEKELSSNLARADGAFPSACADMQSCHDTCRATCPSGWVSCYIDCLNSPTCAKACPKMIAEQSESKKEEERSIAAAVDGLPRTKCSDMLSCNINCRAFCPNSFVSCYTGCLESPTCAPACSTKQSKAKKEESAIAAAVDGLPATKCSNMLSCNQDCRVTCPGSWVSCYIGCLNSPICAKECPKMISEQSKKEEGAIAAAVDGLPATKCSNMLSCNEGCRSDCPSSWVSCYIGCLDSPTCAKTCPKMTSERINTKDAAADALPSSKCPEMLFCNNKCRSTCPSSWVSCYIGCLNSPTCQLPSCPKAMLKKEQEEYGGDDDGKKEGNL